LFRRQPAGTRGDADVAVSDHAYDFGVRIDYRDKSAVALSHELDHLSQIHVGLARRHVLCHDLFDLHGLSPVMNGRVLFALSV
jgi:hypothetical protein